MKLSESKANSLREFQNIFIRSRLQLVGMTHGVMEYIVKNIGKYARKEIPFVQKEISDIETVYGISQIMYDYTCNNVSPEKSVSDKLMEANIIKSLATEYTYDAAGKAQKLLGAKGFEAGHPVSNVAIDFRPFTIFEGPNDMLYAEIYDQFSKATPAEKSEGKKVSKGLTIYERITSDNRFINISVNDFLSEKNNITDFLKRYSLSEIDQIRKVFMGKILARIFLLIQTKPEKILKHIIKDIKKDILDFEYYS